MCVNTDYKGSEEEFSRLVKGIQLKRVVRRNGSLFTPFCLMPIEFDRVYYEDSNDMIDNKYPVSFHAYRLITDDYTGNFFHDMVEYSVRGKVRIEFDVPAIIEDIVAYDVMQVAGRVIYVFSEKTWKEYNTRRKPIHISDEIIVETEDILN